MHFSKYRTEVKPLQFLGVMAALVIIILFSFKKVSLEKTMCAATIVMALSSGLPAAQSVGIIWNAFIDSTTIQLAIAVLAIGVFSTIMKETGYLDNMVRGLSGFLGSLKAAIMAVPALIGSMPVLGGAAVSAPLVDKLGDGLGLPPEAKAGVNLVFRHGMFFLFPFSPAMILVANLIGVSVGTLISKLWLYGVGFCLAGYWALLRNAGVRQSQHAASPTSDSTTGPGCTASPTRENAGPVLSATRTRDFKTKSLAGFLRHGSPLLLALVLSIAFHVPLWASMISGVVLALAMAYFEKAPLPSARTVIEGSNLSQVAAMLWIMAFKEFATISPVFPALVNSAKSYGIPPALLAMVLPALFGYVSAHHTTTMGVMIPILVPAGASPSAVLYFACVIYGASFVAYFASPLHLCQVLTCQYYDVGLAKVYKAYWPVLLSVAAVMAVYAVIATKLIQS